MSDDHVQLPNGQRPDQMLDVKAFAFGQGVAYDDDHKFTSVKLQQGVEFDGLRFCIYSELTPAQARDFAQQLIERAEIVEGTRKEPTGWSA